MLSIMMLHYGDDQIEMTCSAIEAIKHNTVGEYELLVWVNGGVEDQTNEDLAEHHQYVLGTNERVGLARAYNAAANYLSGNVVCVLHNDCFVEAGWNLPLEAVALAGDVAFPIVKENQAIALARGVPPVPDWMPPSCCFAISSENLEKLGGWDEQYEFCHFEDMDLFQRASGAGMRLVQVPGTVFHLRGVTRADQADDANKAFRANEKRYALKHGKQEGDKITYPLPVLELLDIKEDTNVTIH